MPDPTTASTTQENILRLARKLPTTPQIFGRLGLLLNDVNADIDNIVRLVAVDSGLTGRVIRMSNSVYFRGDEPVRSLDQAVNRVGFREMHKMVGVAVSEQVFQSGLPVYHLTAEQMWENSVVTALAMERLARASGDDQGIAYTVGLLRPIGKLVLDMYLEVTNPGLECPEMENFNIGKWERAWTQMTSNEASAIILAEWKMPGEISDGVREHYAPNEAGGRYGALLHAACWITHELGKGMQVESGQWTLEDDTLERCGLTREEITGALDETREALDELKNKLQAA